MEQYIIMGGQPLAGEVVINGAKNAALGIVAAAVMTDEPVMIENLPDVWDINVMLDAIEEAGAVVDRIDRHTVRIVGSLSTCLIDNENMSRMRGSYYLLGALIGKSRKAYVPLPGGCNIGSRPIEQHIKGFSALGAEVEISHGMINATAESLHGSHIYFDLVSVGATINVMLGAVLAEGQTIIENCAREPHIVDVANFLNSMGANIKGAGTDVIRIKGVEKLHGSTYTVIPDQIEAGTFMLAAAATRGDVVIKNVIPKHLEAISAKLIEIGIDVEEEDDMIRVNAQSRPGYTQVKTQAYPGFPTDMQPQMTTLLAVGNGTSIVTETIFENRFKYVDELRKMGADIKVEGNSALIRGVKDFTGATISTPDLRAGAALVIAGLVAEGTTVVEGVEFIERGYEQFEVKLRGLGARIEKTQINTGRKAAKKKAGTAAKKVKANNQRFR
ncbi:MAG: UDP-N-acetylglucosamine 1-carboxyvinyltransferase [Lachnospiraceae bacterium]|nr:UDP-N-acetylglucosamine 1-carboxyvinyltransferase [Lachnospiraceae bacterium]